MKKKIVFVINYFYPDPASTGQLLTELCLSLQHDFRITVIAAQPGTDVGGHSDTSQLFEEGFLQDIRVVRLRLPEVDKSSKFSRIRYILMYFIMANIALWREKSVNIIYTISTPPVLGGVIGTIGKFIKRSKHVYNIQDFNPEQAEAVSYSKNQLIYKAARAVDNFSCRYANNVILVGQDMLETLNQRFERRKLPHYQIINNWTDETDILPMSKTEPHVSRFLEENGLADKFIVMYSGNLGLYYDLENLIKVASDFSDLTDLTFVFIGDGAVKSRMEQFVLKSGLNNVTFLPFQSKSFIRYSLNAADVHLVVNQRGIKGVSVPSKIYGVMAAGKPVLGVLEQGSEAERLISASECGRVVEPQNYEGVSGLVRYFYALDENDRRKMGLNGRHYLERHLKKEDSIAKYGEMLTSLLEEG
ncbi:glycosyltransferase WbuB [Sporolactobacillus shoreae]|uniref:Glycosyltransferase WbuB n=1 Tax=Sporolactobacillus shoreae TaxID=1465501 RepID=A0A4Z0GSQ1_9BACL|nr:glycosyltransferase family 4 protein [Sporolactobacillus shoreae]TGA99957.1 glycosyltransferase WbuB [Sporolactobacillus shoreae]